MERLSKRHKYKGKEHISVDSKSKQYGICSNFCTNCGRADCDDIEKALFKLAEYEDLEEQGKLLKLPCAVGDTVYVILPHDSHITEAQINKIEVKPTVYGKMCCFVEPVAHRGRLYRYFENDFGKTVFLVIDEAVQKVGGKGGGTQ